VIADLHDQARWSSYAQDIPRLGDPSRESLRLARMWRFARGLKNPRRALSGDWKTAVSAALVVGLAVLAVSALISLLISAF
jgi:hypothetical protein